MPTASEHQLRSAPDEACRQETPQSASHYPYAAYSASDPSTFSDILPSHYAQSFPDESNPDFEGNVVQYPLQSLVEGNTTYEHTTTDMVRAKQSRATSSGPSGGWKSRWSRRRAPVAPAQISVRTKFRDICQDAYLVRDHRWYNTEADRREYRRDCWDFGNIWRYENSVITNRDLYDLCFPPRPRRH